MINEEKWVNSLYKVNTKSNEEINELDHSRWVNTISKKNTYNTLKKYSFMTVLFICGLVFVSIVKNETRNLQKATSKLQANIKEIKFNLDQAKLDNEVITSPTNISLLAKEYLNNDLDFYKRSQILLLKNEEKMLSKIKETKKEEVIDKQNVNLKTNIKKQFSQRIEQKKAELKKLQILYSKPETLPKEVRTKVAKKITEKKIEIKNIYDSPKDIFTYEKAQKWAAIQIVKAFLGIPIVPGK